MKLLIYSHAFTPQVGGIENAVLSIAKGLAETRMANGTHEFNITVVTQASAANFDDAALPFPVVRQPGLAELWKLIRGTDAVHVAGPALWPMFFAWISRKPLVVEHHGYQAICLNGLLLHRPDGSICPGHFQARKYLKCLSCRAAETGWAEALKSLLLMFPRNFLSRRTQKNIAVSEHVLKRNALPRASVIYHGIADCPSGSRARSVASSEIVFAYVGRFVSEKGVPILIQAAEKLVKEKHAFRVLLIGDGPERPQIDALIGDAGLEGVIQITGYLTGSDLSQALSNVHAVIIPSVCEETAGLAAIEQMCRGGLVIASNIGGLVEVVGDAGLLFPAGDASGLAACMRMVLQDPSLPSSFEGKALDRAARLFQRSRMVEEHAVEYRRLFEQG